MGAQTDPVCRFLKEVVLDADFGPRPSFGLRSSGFGFGRDPTGFRGALSGFPGWCETACVKRVHSHNSPVLGSGRALACVPGLTGDGRGQLEFFIVWICCLLAAVLAGCATGPREFVAQVPNWEGEGVVTAPMAVEVPVPPPAPAPVVAPPTPAAPSNQPAETWVPLSRWCKANGLPA